MTGTERAATGVAEGTRATVRAFDVRGRMKKRLATVAFITSVLACVVGPANAEFGSTGSAGNPVTQVSLANNKTHRVDFMDTTTATGASIHWALNNKFPTFDFTWVWVDGSDYDVRILDDYYNTGLFAWVNCPSWATEGGVNPDRWCYGQYLKRDLSSPTTTNSGRYVACHELGHTVGLRHELNDLHSDSCMRIDAAVDIEAPDPHYSQEDINAVLAHYWRDGGGL